MLLNKIDIGASVLQFSFFQLAYYGLITQNTGEDWVNIPLSLSTAVPSQGGTIPTLGTKEISFKQPPPPPAPVVQYVQAPMMYMAKGGYHQTQALEMVEERNVCMSAPMMHAVSQVRALLLLAQACRHLASPLFSQSRRRPVVLIAVCASSVRGRLIQTFGRLLFHSA